MTSIAVRAPPLTPALQGGVVGAAIVAAAFFPGQMSYDSLVQLTQARSGTIDDLHPPLMSWIWRLLEVVWAGAAPILLLQLAVLVVGLALHARWLASGDRAFLMPLVVLWCPSVFAVAGTIWKDVLFAGTCLLASGVLMQAHWPTRRRAGLALAALLACACFRHNGISAVLPLAIWTAATLLSTRARWVQALVGVCLTGLIFIASSLLTRVLAETPTSNPSQQILLHDLAAITAATGTTYTPGAYLEQHPACAGERLTAAYARNPNNVAVVVFGSDAPCPPAETPEAIADIKRAWKTAVIAAPRPWLAHRWSLWRTLLGAIDGPVYYPFHHGVDPNGLGVTFAPVIPAKLTNPLLERTRDSIFFRAYAWLGLGLVVSFVGFRRRRPELIALPMSAWCFALAYLPTAPVADFRLVWWCVVAVAVAFGLMLGVKSGERVPDSPSGAS